MNRQWLDRLLADAIVLLDGGTGSELRKRGVEFRADVWSGHAARDFERLLVEIHGDYIRAGADIITTNTFATSRFVLASAGLDDEFEAINRRAVDAARAARDAVADRRVAIAGSMSCFPPRFDPTAYPDRESEKDAYRELAALLAEAGVDLIALEMIQDIEHGGLALRAALETGLPVVLGLSARRSDSGLVAYDFPDRRFEPILDGLLALGPDVVAVMHTPLDAIGDALAAIRSSGWMGPMGAYPELGDYASEGPDRASAIGPSALVAAATAWVRVGARLLGGCCGTGPDHIAALADARDQLRAARACAAAR